MSPLRTCVAQAAADAMETSSSDPPPSPPLRRRQRRLIFDRRYGLIFDEWTDPADAALAGGRGMFCVLPMARSLVDVAVSSVAYAADSVNQILKRSEISSSVAYLPPLALPRNSKHGFANMNMLES